MPYDASGSWETAASPTASQPSPATVREPRRVRREDARRGGRAAVGLFNAAAGVFRRFEERAPAVGGARRAALDKVAVGHVSRDQLPARQPRRIPPTGSDRLDERERVFTPDTLKVSGDADEPVVTNAARTEQAREAGGAARRVNDEVGATRLVAPAGLDVQLPAAPFTRAADEPTAVSPDRARLDGRVRQLLLEPAAVELPAVAARPEDEVALRGLGRAPHETVAVGRERRAAQMLDETQSCEKRVGARRQTLADLRPRPVLRFEQDGREARARE